MRDVVIQKLQNNPEQLLHLKAHRKLPVSYRNVGSHVLLAEVGLWTSDYDSTQILQAHFVLLGLAFESYHSISSTHSFMGATRFSRHFLRRMGWWRTFSKMRLSGFCVDLGIFLDLQ